MCKVHRHERTLAGTPTVLWCRVSVLFIGKRFYTDRDALRERYGRIYQLPWHWSNAGIPAKLWLVDYHTRETISQRDDRLDVISTPVRNLAVIGHYARTSRNATKSARTNVVVASGDCYIGLLGYRVAKRLRARFVFDVYDKYDEFGGYRRLPGFDPFQFLLRRADARLFASRALLEQVGYDPRRDFVVPNGIDTQRFRPLDMQSSRAQLGLPDKIPLAGYFGGMDEDRGIGDLLAAHQKLHEAGSDLQLLLAGKPRKRLNLEREGVRYLGDLAYTDVPRALACCDLLVLPYRRSAYLDMASSCKIAEYLAMQRPIVATRTPNFEKNFPAQAAQLGDRMAAPNDPHDLARALSEQSTVKLLVAMPDGMDWSSIAGEVSRGLQLCA